MEKFDDTTRALLEQYVGSVDDVQMSSAYDAADQVDRGMALWAPPIQSADADILPEKQLSDARVRDLQRNDGYAQAGRRIHKDSIVGSMFMLNLKPNVKALGIDDETWEEEICDEVEAKFTLGAESVNAWIDASRNNTFTDLIRLAVGVYTSAGEMLASAEWLNQQRDRPFSTAIQMIDVDRLMTPYDRMGDKNVRGGIEMDRYGAARGYHIRDNTSIGLLGGAFSNETRYIPARTRTGRMQMIHIREQERPHQTRGMSDIVAGLKVAKITSKFRDVTLQNAVAGALYAASVESELPSADVFTQLGGGMLQRQGKNAVRPGEIMGEYGTDFLTQVATYAGRSKNLFIDGVKIPHLFPGTKLQIRPVSTPGGVGQDFEASLVRYLASLLGVSYEQLSKDLSGTNYSGIKAGVNETRKFMESRKRFVADRFATIILTLWFEEMLGRGEIEAMKYSRLPNFYEGINREAYCTADWIGAGYGQIDELKETQAAALRIKSLLSTYEDEFGRQGKDWKRKLKQRAREQKYIDELGLVVEEDNSMNAASGTGREPADAEEGSNASNQRAA